LRQPPRRRSVHRATQECEMACGPGTTGTLTREAPERTEATPVRPL
jgi:hypothetical protein